MYVSLCLPALVFSLDVFIRLDNYIPFRFSIRCKRFGWYDNILRSVCEFLVKSETFFFLEVEETYSISDVIVCYVIAMNMDSRLWVRSTRDSQIFSFANTR